MGTSAARSSSRGNDGAPTRPVRWLASVNTASVVRQRCANSCQISTQSACQRSLLSMTATSGPVSSNTSRRATYSRQLRARMRAATESSRSVLVLSFTAPTYGALRSRTADADGASAAAALRYCSSASRTSCDFGTRRTRASRVSAHASSRGRRNDACDMSCNVMHVHYTRPSLILALAGDLPHGWYRSREQSRKSRTNTKPFPNPVFSRSC